MGPLLLYTICDVEFEGENLRCYVLDREMKTTIGDLVNPKTGDVVEKGEITAKGITGTGVIALRACLKIQPDLTIEI